VILPASSTWILLSQKLMRGNNDRGRALQLLFNWYRYVG
jgi:hypothetical protein